MYLYQINGAATLNREMRMRLRPMREQTAPVLHTGALLGMLDIPRANVSSVILEGDDDRTLAVSVGHIPGTALPGQDGNVVLAGHRDTFFRGLGRIRPQDIIRYCSQRRTGLDSIKSSLLA
jgi:sortase A